MGHSKCWWGLRKMDKFSQSMFNERKLMVKVWIEPKFTRPPPYRNMSISPKLIVETLKSNDHRK